jgi:hypothetical protein
MFLPSNITLQFGDSGDFVTELQRRLAVVKCFSEDMVNGFFDGNTVGGVTQFQVMVGLHADGVAGPETLRRLNGVIAGGGSATTEDNKEEEKTLHDQTQHMVNVAFTLQQQENPAMWGTTAPEQPRQEAPKVEAPLPPMQPLSAQQPSQEALREQERALAQQQQHQNQTLSNMIAFDAAARGAPPPPPDPSQKPDMPEASQEAAVAREQPRGIIGRITQFANSTIQRLSEQFESRLPANALKEVREIGLAMASTGMKQTPIPAGAELPGPGQTPAPGRGPEQVQRV